MRSLFLLALSGAFLGSLSTQASAEAWVELFDEERGDVWLIDSDRVSVKGDLVTAWVKQKSLRRDSPVIMASTNRTEFNCALRVRRYTYIIGEFWDGQVHAGPRDDAFARVTPGSVGAQVLKTVCEFALVRPVAGEADAQSR